MTVLITDHPSVKGYLVLKSISNIKPFMTLKYVEDTSMFEKLVGFHEVTPKYGELESSRL